MAIFYKAQYVGCGNARSDAVITFRICFALVYLFIYLIHLSINLLFMYLNFRGLEVTSNFS